MIVSNPLADSLPPGVRSWIYRILATLYGIELVIDVLGPGVETKVVGISAVLGFALAASNVKRPEA
jgi:hypothetical protein